MADGSWKLKYLYMTAVLLLATGCASLSDMTKLNKKVNEDSTRVEQMVSAFTATEAERQKVIADMTRLELKGIDSGKLMTSWKRN